MESSETLTWHLSIAYDGGNYHGWQVQPKIKTVQGELLQRLRLMFRNPELKIYGCSRTDAGVHALDQQVSFTVQMPKDLCRNTFAERLNRWLPDDILITSARVCENEFNARYDNFGKAYIYSLSPAKKVNPIFSNFVWRTPRQLQVDKMRQAAEVLTGEHDFASFAVNSGKEMDSTVRNVYKIELIEKDEMIYVSVLGESFLYKMVRSIVGYLVHVGMGHSKAENTIKVLQGKDRSLAADSAPAQGLFLAKVFLTPDEWQDYQPILPPFKFQNLKK